MDFLFTLLFWLFGLGNPASQVDQMHLDHRQLNPGHQIEQPANTGNQPVIDLIETNRISIRTRIQHTIVIFEDTHFRPGKSN